jgi:glycosyltransferase involved in cell wall biosynthesis
MDKILTIGIPTFNGGKYIGLAINSVLNQLKNNPLLESRTEIVVSDNASQDNVGSIVKKYEESYPKIVHYYRNEKNIGFDRNVDLVVSRAGGKFVWLISDDDFITDGAIENVLKVIETNLDERISVIFANYYNSIRLKNKEDVLCKDGNVFLQKTRFKSGLISSNIVSKASWQESKLEQFFETGWIHFGYVLSALSPLSGNKGYILNNELVKTGGEGRWGKGGTFIFIGFELVKIFKLMPQMGYDKRTSKMAIYVIKGGYPLLIPLAKAQGLKTDLKQLRRFYTLFRQYPSFWLIDFPLLLIPKKIYELAYLIIRRIKSPLKVKNDIK